MRVLSLAASALLHATVAIAVLALQQTADAPDAAAMAAARTPARPAAIDIRRVVFTMPGPTGGGGGGGNRQPGPIRRATGIGSDAITLRVRRPVATTGRLDAVTPLPAVVLDAKPLAGGTEDVIGLPTGGVSFGTSTGPGSGGGVGDGRGTGIGSGTGPGVGPGSGGGIGGGVYRPGGAVTSPRLVLEVKPTYTTKALIEKIQGTVIVEMVVRANGVPAGIRVIRSLDPGGLDDQAVSAVAQWRFEPGRLAAAPVDVLVTVMLDFTIR